MIFEYLNDFRVFEWFSSIWVIFEYLSDFRGFEWFLSFWMIFEYLNDFRVFEWFSSISMIFEHLNDFRAFDWFSSIWLIFKHLIDFRAFDWFSSLHIENSFLFGKETFKRHNFCNLARLYVFYWKVAGSIPDSVIGIFHWHNTFGRTLALESTKPQTEMITRTISWVVKENAAYG